MALPHRDRLLTGRPGPPPARIALAAGPTTCVLDGPDLRDVRRGGRILAQRVYMAVRDEGWGTVPGTMTDLVVDAGDGGFTVTFRSRHRQDAIDVEWEATITGSPDGTLRYRMDAVAHEAFRYCKIGFNVHHPLLETVGRQYRAEGEDGSTFTGTVEPAVEPQRVVDGRLTAMFDPYRALAIDYLDGAEVRFAFSGDLFEMQDHRNWADGNFKSYGTPLSVPWPMDAAPGQRFVQEVVIAAAGLDDTVSAGGPTRLVLGDPDPRARVPRLGLGRPDGAPPLRPGEVDLLRLAAPEHLRVAVRLHDPEWPRALADGVADCRALGAALELAVSSEDGDEPALADLAGRLAAAGVPVARVLVLERQEAFTPVAPITTAAALARVRAALAGTVGDAPFAGGSDQFFSDVNRDPPPAEGLDAVCFGLCPQVHAADDASLMENLAALPDCVETARILRPGRPVAVSPVTLAARLGPYPGGAPAPGGPPASVDVRLQALFGASWTLGAIAWLAGVATESVTLYETAGPRGVVAGDVAPPYGGLPAGPGEAHPVLHVLADVAGGGRVRAVRSDAPLEIGALALDGPDGLRVLLANHGPDGRVVELAGLPWTTVGLRVLDEATAAAAMAGPAAFRAAGERRPAPGGALRLDLGPYAVARVEGAPDGTGEVAGP